MWPTDFWETSTEGLGTSYAGGWAVDPAGGAAAFPPITSAWGVRVHSDPNWPSAQAGTALLIETSEVEIYITGFRAEDEFGFNAEPYVRTGRCQ